MRRVTDGEMYPPVVVKLAKESLIEKGREILPGVKDWLWGKCPVVPMIGELEGFFYLHFTKKNIDTPLVSILHHFNPVTLYCLAVYSATIEFTAEKYPHAYSFKGGN